MEVAVDATTDGKLLSADTANFIKSGIPEKIILLSMPEIVDLLPELIDLLSHLPEIVDYLK